MAWCSLRCASLAASSATDRLWPNGRSRLHPPYVRLVVASKKYSFRSSDNNETKIFPSIYRAGSGQAAFAWPALGARSRARSQRQLPHGQELDEKGIVSAGGWRPNQREAPPGLECLGATAGPARNPRPVRPSPAGVVSSKRLVCPSPGRLERGVLCWCESGFSPDLNPIE